MPSLVEIAKATSASSLEAFYRHRGSQIGRAAAKRQGMTQPRAPHDTAKPLNERQRKNYAAYARARGEIATTPNRYGWAARESIQRERAAYQLPWAKR